MKKNKLFITINILGMAISIGCCIVAYFNWEFDDQFDHHHKNAASIYRVSSIREFEKVSKLYGYVPLPLGAAIKQNIPDVNKVVRMSWSFSNFKVADNLFESRIAYVDADFFDMFSFDILSGQASGLKDKSNVFISDELAIKLFGSTDVLGKQVTQVLSTELKEVVVGGVFKKQPSNSSFGEDAYMQYDNLFDDASDDVTEDSWKNRNTLFVLINDPGRVESVHKQIQPYRENNNKVREDFIIKEFALEPL